MRSSICTIAPTDWPPVDAETGEEARPAGYVEIGRLPATDNHPDGLIVLHAAPETPPPPGVVEVVLDGRQKPWTWSKVPTDHAGIAPRVMEAIWEEEETVDGRNTRVRKRGKEAKVPPERSPLKTNVPPHLWAGETP